MGVFTQKSMKSIKSNVTCFFLTWACCSFTYADSLFVLTGESVNSNLIDLPAKSFKSFLLKPLDKDLEVEIANYQVEMPT